MIVVVGGDGTMNEVVDGIVSCDMVTLGYIPVGTGSDLARGLRLSRRPMRGLRRIFKARRIRQIDYGVIAYGDDVLRHRRFYRQRRGSGWMRRYASICSVRRSKISATGFICGDCRTGYWDLYSI